MSGIAGIYNLDGRPADASLLRRMTDAIAHRGPDGVGHWVHGPVGLGQRMLHTTPESLLEQQPLMDESGTLCLTLDGRVDNREELRAALEAKGARLRDDTDAELVLRAYECWGEESPAKIIGDFAFAIWDGRNQQLFCARDALGVRPFYYHKADGFLAFASDPTSIFALPDVVPSLRLDGLVDYLVNNFRDTEPTEFQQVCRLRPAHALIVNEKSFRLRRYWDVDPNRELPCRHPVEYAEAFLDVFSTAVKARLRTTGNVGILLSGGLDSSSILCLVEDLRKQGKVNMGLRPYSALFDGQPYDESQFLRSIQELWGTEIRFSRPSPPAPLWALPEACRRNAQPLCLPLAYIPQKLLDVAASEGTRVVLAGLGGDDFMDAPVGLAAEFMASGHALQAWDYTLALAKFHSVSVFRAARSALIRPFISKLLPDWFKSAYRTIRPLGTFEWLQPGPAHAALERLRSTPWYLRERKFRTPGRRTTYDAIHTGHRIQVLEYWDRLAAAAGGIEIRQPFCDRRVVEFAAAVPDEVMGLNGKPKGLMRAALGSRLPSLIQRRNTKADFAGLINRRLIFNDAPAVKQLLRNSSLAELGLVNQEQACKAYRNYRERYIGRLARKEAVDTIWGLISLEGWLRTAEV